MTLFLTLLTGLIYPSLITGLCQVLFPDQANGSLISRNGKVIGSALIGQNFSKPEYFQPRPSAAGSDGYDASLSSGSNLGPTSQKLIDRVKASVEKVKADNPDHSGTLPADLVTASGSGLDPHITPGSMSLQIARVANARGASASDLEQFANRFIEGRDLGVLGEPRVNVLQLNLALDEKFPARK
jgi:K+-transporting ATPase ATPase C chain